VSNLKIGRKMKVKVLLRYISNTKYVLNHFFHPTSIEFND